MPLAVRLLVAFALVAVAAFCVFGFLATFEPPGFLAVRLVYGILGILCLAGAARLAFPRRPMTR
jgi:hypothetical protein